MGMLQEGGGTQGFISSYWGDFMKELGFQEMTQIF